MAKLSQYRILRACDLYNANGGLNNPPIRFGLDGWEDNCWGSPIYGTEVDWYYMHGAFAIVCEYGTHQRLPTKEEIKEEFDRTWQGFLLFIDKAPLVQLKGI